ncbi:MAG: flagellar biosynthesis anti-sigma factor FlgM [Pirellulales bacterium]|nr:flagellar biosynthesis anti-sigma factor FlgM [Pirellulales bacterium]
MQIYGPAHLHGPQSINAPHHLRQTSPVTPPSSPGQVDSVEISEAALRAAEMQSPDGIRWDRVEAVRRQIAEGTYETEEKLGLALDRMLDQLG